MTDKGRQQDERLLSAWTGTVLPWCEDCSCHHPPGACRQRRPAVERWVSEDTLRLVVTLLWMAVVVLLALQWWRGF